MSHQTTSSSSSHFEFLGPHGTILVVLAVPFTAFTLQLLNDPVKGFPPPSFYTSPFATLKDRFAESTIFNITSFLIVWAWLAFQAALHGFLPGTYAKGNPVPATGQRLEYKINAFSCLVATYLALYVLFSARGVEPFLWVADNMLPLATATSTIALTASVLLYVLSHRIPEDPVHNPVITAAGGDTGYPLYDFWMGRELNPRLFGWFDLKYFCELRPGIIGWTVLNLCLAIKQHHIFGSVSDGMLLVVLFQGYYAIDALWNERAILTTMDITTDGFGMMLCFGDLVWVPFTYSLQALYLATNPASLSRTSILAIVLLELFGMYIFRAANSEKNAFRTDPTHPSVQHLEYINTQRGTRLLVSGWWGLARHINYFGDWLMGLAWCLTTGFASPIPYFYALYFAILLVHRDRRDEAVCRAKYGADWDVYTATVPYRFIPGLW
ncbi:ergosterol biosynthesis ERG4/ERG24 [Powellomyces hirtus]|nr:ergosterol biosynthesis ERG4/ERG24 [Powellomyces hirtus]